VVAMAVCEIRERWLSVFHMHLEFCMCKCKSQILNKSLEYEGEDASFFPSEVEGNFRCQ
jgi:hypothetical protein